MRKNIHGFGSLARRRSKKPFILALNGMAFGGGAETIVNAGAFLPLLLAPRRP